MSWDREPFVKMADGLIVERDVYNVAKSIAEYDPNLRLKYLNPDIPGVLTDAPYALFEICPDGVERLVFNIWELDARVLDRVRKADMNRNSDILGRLDKTNAQARSNERRRFREEYDTSKDLVKHIFKSPKGEYTFKNPKGHTVKISDDPKDKSGVVDIKNRVQG